MKVKAYAKINLALDVVRKREDGYHELEMIMAPITLHDLIYINIIDSGIEIASNSKIKNTILPIIIAILLCLYPINIANLMDTTSRKNLSGIDDEIRTEANIIKENVELNDKVYIIYQNIGGGYEYHKLRYSISPIVTNLLYEWSLGPKYYESDIWSLDLTKEEFEKKLIDEEFDYVFIAKIDKQFVDIYGSLINFDFTTQNYEELNNKLLKIEKINENEVILNLVN